MMDFLSSKELHSLPVYTQSNEHLGSVAGFEMDMLEQNIQYYFVNKHKLSSTLLPFSKLESADYKIHRSQVISLNKEKMVVEDAVIKEKILEQEQEESAKPLLEEEMP